MNYDDIGDRQLNFLLKNSLFGEDWQKEDALCRWDFNNPSDSWLIVLANKISITWVGSYWQVQAPLEVGSFGVRCKDGNPLRSAMIVFLMMQEGENGL